MSTNPLLQNLRVTYQHPGLRFCLMFLGVVIAPVVIFVNAGADASAQNSANLLWQSLTLGGLLCTALLLGWAMFNRKTRSLSISAPPAAKSATDHGVI